MGGLLLTGCPTWTSLKSKLKPDALQSISSSTAFRQRKPWASGAFYGGGFFSWGSWPRRLGERRQDSPVVEVFSASVGSYNCIPCQTIATKNFLNFDQQRIPAIWSVKSKRSFHEMVQWYLKIGDCWWIWVDFRFTQRLMSSPHVRLLAVACAYLKCPAMVLKPKQSHEDLQSLLLHQGRKNWWRSVSCQLWALLILLWWRHLLPSCINNIQ